MYGGEPVALTSMRADKDEIAHVWPVFLPDGKHFIYVGWSMKQEDTLFYLASSEVSAAAQKPIPLMPAYSQAAYVPAKGQPGHLVFARQGTLLAQPFDARTLK